VKFEYLSTVNAVLNLICLIFLLNGYRHIKAGRRDHHKRSMIAAFMTSVLFLISYLIYHANVGSVPFQGTGWRRPLYFTVLISHIILAAVIVPMSVMTLYRGLTGKFEQHKPLAKKTFPVWVYVSVTGVVVYLMLYQIH
jgi:putative membrane protein